MFARGQGLGAPLPSCNPNSKSSLVGTSPCSTQPPLVVLSCQIELWLNAVPDFFFFLAFVFSGFF